MDQFVVEFTKNPDKYRSLLSEDDRKKISKSVQTTVDMAPRTDKIALEAKIMFRRFPNIAVVAEVKKLDEPEKEVPVVKKEIPKEKKTILRSKLSSDEDFDEGEVAISEEDSFDVLSDESD